MASLQRLLIGLHRAVKGEEILIAAKGVGKNAVFLRVAIAAYPLGITISFSP